MSSMISPILQEKFKKIKRLQKALNSINISNAKKVTNIVESLQFLNSESDRAELVENLILISGIKPLSISLLADLTKTLQTPELIQSILLRVFEPIPETFNDMFNKSIEFKFLRRCMDKGIISFDSIRDAMQNFQKQFPDHKSFYLVFLCWFAPEMDSKMFNQFNSLMTEQIVMKKCPGFLKDFSTDFPFLRQNNWKQFKERVKYGHFMNTIAYCLKYDDIDRFGQITSQNNFNFNFFIKPSIYEPSPILRDGAPLIHFAAYFGSIQCFKFLLLHQANLKLKNSNKTLVQYAIAGGNCEIIRICQQNLLEFDNTLYIAAFFHQKPVFDWIHSIQNNDLEQKSVEYGTVLHQAVSGYNVSQIYDLIKYEGIGPNILDFNQRTPLHFAVLCNMTNSIKLLLSIDSVNPNLQDKDGNTPFMLAVKNSKTEVIQAFIDCNKVNINLKCNNSISPLHLLAKNDHFHSLPMLLRSTQLDLNTLDNKGRTPFYKAVMKNNMQAVQDLCSIKGIEINAPDNNGMSPLHVAVQNGNLNLISTILNNTEIDINAQDNNKLTPLHIAVSQTFNDQNIVTRYRVVSKLLKRKGIDLSLRNQEGQTAAELARQNQLMDIASLIMNYNA